MKTMPQSSHKNIFPVYIQNDKPFCPVCSHEMKFLYRIDRFCDPIFIYRCPECCLEKQHPFAEHQENHYTEDYYSGKAEYSYSDERKQLKFYGYVWKARLKNIQKFIPPPADFLDAGCAFGGFALEAAQTGFRAFGLDLSEYAVQHAKKAGLNAKIGELKKGVYPENSFDVITMIEVMEHLPDPVSAVKTLSEIIRPGGLLVIQTANFQGMQAKREKSNYHYYLPGHLYYYSKNNLTRFLNDHGFSKIIFYPGVDFGLLPKLLKSRGNFRLFRDYLKWIRISIYHLISKIAFGNFAMTSSMVIYAFRDKN